MANPSAVTYTGDGSTTDFVIPFLYISASHVNVTLDGVATEDFDFLSASTIRFDAAPAAAVAIKVYRETPGTPIVTWADGAVILGRHLNSAQAQPTYIAEEALTVAEDAVDDASTAATEAAEAAIADAQDALTTAVTDAQDAATAAEAAAADAASALLNAAAAFDAFDDRYLGQKAADPVLDNDGNPLVAGAVYFNTVINKWKVWNGSVWTTAYNEIASASLIENDSGVDGATAADALDTLDADITAVEADVTALDAAKADVVHVHATGDITGLTALLGADYQTFTASGTWTKPSKGTVARIQCWGGGGSGARHNSGFGGGGGGGGYNERWMLLSALGASETVTVGAGGASQASANTNGNAGAISTFGTHLTAYAGGAGGQGAQGGGGGGGGTRASGSAGTSTTGGAGGSGDGGTGGGTDGDPDVPAPGEAATIGGGGGGSGNAVGGKAGGKSLWGGGGGAGAANSSTAGAGGLSGFGGDGGDGGSGATPGTAGSQPGGGGGATDATASGAGGDGMCIVTVF